MQVQVEAGGTITVDGEQVAAGAASFWRERAEVTIDGQHWVFRSRIGALVAESSEGHSMRVRRASLGSRWEVSGKGGTYTIARKGIMTWTFEITAGDQSIAEVRNTAVFRNRPAASFADGTPRATAVFLLWVVFTLIKRESARASSSSMTT